MAAIVDYRFELEKIVDDDDDGDWNAEIECL